MVGALIAYFFPGKAGLNQKLKDYFFNYSNLLAFLGMVLIACSTFLITSNMKYPGFSTAIPIIGTMLLLISGEQVILPFYKGVTSRNVML